MVHHSRPDSIPVELTPTAVEAGERRLCRDLEGETPLPDEAASHPSQLAVHQKGCWLGTGGFHPPNQDFEIRAEPNGSLQLGRPAPTTLFIFIATTVGTGLE